MILKNNINIVLSRTYDPGNVGSIIRAMKNFSFTNLISINQINNDIEVTKKMAAGAKDNISQIRYGTNLKEELLSSNIVYAFTARKRNFYSLITASEMANEIVTLHKEDKVVLLFGNETNGLNNEELMLADKLVKIPTNPEYSSLNLASSVLIALYEIQNKIMDANNSLSNKTLQIKKNNKENLIEMVYSVIENDIFNDKKQRKHLLRNIRKFFGKMKLSEKESYFIKTLFTIISKKMQRKRNDV